MRRYQTTGQKPLEMADYITKNKTLFIEADKRNQALSASR